jgi:hypothetical protein
VELDSRSGISLVAANDRVEYTFVNSTAYRYYRIAMGSAGPGNLLGFATFEIYALAQGSRGAFFSTRYVK